MSSNDIYTLYNIDKSKLKRDYIKQPIKITPNGVGSEKLSREELQYLYIELNLSKKEIQHFLNIKTKSVIERWIKLYKIKKPHNQIYNKIQKTLMRKYNCNCSFLIQSAKEKSKQTNMKKYGVENYSSTKECRLKVKQTNLEKYGCECVLQSEIIKNKIKQTCLEKYGVENYTQTNEYKNVFKQTCLEKYGVENPFQNEEIKEKSKQTNLERYGVEFYSQSNEYKMMFNDDKFVSIIQDKQYQSKKKNNTFNTSKPEDEIYKLLQEKYGEVKRQYKSDLYPFRCDFYIPSIDLYIEYQGMWTHGKEPYANSLKQQEIVKLWESKNTKYYNLAIQIWTVTDPLKRQIAKDNNLNWLEFFNMSQFIDWYNKKEE